MTQVLKKAKERFSLTKEGDGRFYGYIQAVTKVMWLWDLYRCHIKTVENQRVYRKR